MAPAAYAEFVQRNARRWEEMAKYRFGMTLEQHRAGVSAMEPGELDLRGDVRGQRVLHLACAVDDGITMASHGARVVGVDIPETHVRMGREKAEALGIEIELRVGHMMNLDEDLRNFDLVHIGSGSLCWVPDLDDWLTGVRTVLRPGGRLLISEHHPFWETMGVAGDRQLTVLCDYFGATTLSATADASRSAIGTAETSDDDNTLQSFVWGIGAVVSALLRHEFEVVAPVELPYPEMFVGVGEAADCVPAVYRLMGRRGQDGGSPAR
jgi:SAM-dependent methyltransferase